jgi:hypothetical protein
VPLEIRNACGHTKVSHRENAAYWTFPANPQPVLEIVTRRRWP